MPRTKHERAKWVTDEFLSLLDTRKYRMHRYRTTPTPLNWRLRQEAIKVAHDFKIALQREYAEESLRQSKGDFGETWRVLKKLWPLKNKKSSIENFGGTEYNTKMANIMNAHFATVGAKLAANIHTVEHDYRNIIHPPNFSLKEITSNDVQELIAQLSPSKASGEDGVTARLS